ncbi:MAG TPA: Mur ligase family protein [Candidatus Saccharimonadales bacterium]|nr:Mur ligase family protein [Candidatus Saccharimonadales bacterium]
MPEKMRPEIISVTGTKGKSTIVYILAQILSQSQNTLRVDTTGCYINGDKKSGFEDSTRLAGLVPTVAPGRFLTLMQDFDNFTAILECSLGSSNLPGLGYSHHSVGVFTNVYEDHIGNTDRLKTREDIALAKRFIFSRLRPNGYAVFNADDKLVCSQLDACKPGVIMVPCGFEFSAFDNQKHMASGGSCVAIENGWVVVKSAQKVDKIVQLESVTWTFNGAYLPSVWNLMFIVGALWAHGKGSFPKNWKESLTNSRLDPLGGRLISLRSQNGVTIIADYAHEKYSLAAIGDLAKKLCADGGKVIGIVRLAYDRSDELIADTAKHIAGHFDELIVYDKIDGFLRKPKETLGKFKMIVGYISKVFSSELEKYNPNVVRIVREDEAINYAAKMAKSGDVVVHIVNDDIEQSMNFIKRKFKAELV